MPSKQSLSYHQYYAHPQNAFWWIMSNLLGFSEKISYQQRCDQLSNKGYALWDVLYDAERKTSLDSDIVHDTIVVNDIEGLLKTYPSIKMLAFNGVAAKQIFLRHCSHLLDQNEGLQCVQLPSTSPAYAAIDRQQKLIIWQKQLLHFETEN